MNTDVHRPKQSYRYSVTISIKHPNIDPAEISTALNLLPEHSWRFGEPRVTRTGKLMGGRPRTESYWYYVEDVDDDRYFLDGACVLLEELEEKRDFVLRLTETGGNVSINIGLPGRRNIGDVIGPDALMRFVALRVELGIEVFPDMELPDGLGGGPKAGEEVWIPATGQFWTQDETGRWVHRGSAAAFIRDCLRAGIPLPPKAQD